MVPDTGRIDSDERGETATKRAGGADLYRMQCGNGVVPLEPWSDGSNGDACLCLSCVQQHCGNQHARDEQQASECPGAKGCPPPFGS